jgi:hypothetical protein
MPMQLVSLPVQPTTLRKLEEKKKRNIYKSPFCLCIDFENFSLLVVVNCGMLPLAMNYIHLNTVWFIFYLILIENEIFKLARFDRENRQNCWFFAKS